MTHSFSSDLLLSNLDAALFADLAFVTDSLILSAEALPVLCGTEDSLAEKTVSFCLECAVVDRFGLFYFTVRPASYHFRRRQTYFYRIKNIAFH